MEIDHIYICTENKAPAGDLLVEFGLKEGSPNTHPGQGTTNRRFYFYNLMLELSWVEDTEEVQNERTKSMRLFERCQLDSTVSSPLGIAFRPTDGKMKQCPFQYSGDFDPEGLLIADKLKCRYGDNLMLWRYSVNDYHKSLSANIASRPRLKQLNNVLSGELKFLAAAIAENGLCGYQEQLAEDLINDIKIILSTSCCC